MRGAMNSKYKFRPLDHWAPCFTCRKTNLHYLWQRYYFERKMLKIHFCMHTYTYTHIQMHTHIPVYTCFTFTWCDKWWPCSILQTYNIFWSIRKMTFGTNDRYACWIYKTPIMQHCCIWYRTSSIINIQSWTGYWNWNIYIFNAGVKTYCYFYQHKQNVYTRRKTYIFDNQSNISQIVVTTALNIRINIELEYQCKIGIPAKGLDIFVRHGLQSL